MPQGNGQIDVYSVLKDALDKLEILVKDTRKDLHELDKQFATFKAKIITAATIIATVITIIINIILALWK